MHAVTLAQYQQRLPRVPFDRPIQIRNGRRVEQMRALNLSLGGMFVESDARPFGVGTRLAVALDTGPMGLSLGEAEVVWRAEGDHPGFGLRFTTLQPTGRSLVEAVVRHGGTSSLTPNQLSAEETTKPEANLPPLPSSRGYMN